MLAYTVRKFFFSVVVLLFASVTIFVLVNLGPDPLTELKNNPRISQADVQRITRIYGLDESLPERYLIWAGGLLRGDLGYSVKLQSPVSELIVPRVWPTALLMGSSLIFTVLIAIPFGVYSAIKKYGALDNVGTFLSFVGYSMPSFWLGLILQLVLGVYLTSWAGVRIFYTSGMSGPEGGGLVDLLQHLTLPVLTLSAISIASYSRFQRGAMLDVLSSDYLRTARAKGLSRRRVYLKHALRNALVPVVTVIALDMGVLFGGAVITETVFAWPGLGFLLADSLYKGDYNVAQGLLMISAALIVFFNYVADVAYAVVDPRIGYE
ncbi:MAG: Oligopeptide transport system permease protein OppB [uncultured Rubrobacteraceae bacterium]|uniref:Oligopeptide transport system permease protein OppB n=1 Tax=uncultured Rubrobacteraceae bacterium TaxID=349277 RepID=A0A6J4PGJ1_9ACTN|nr:MAG: Oligopeptide transport system permease protein OppB [uncultured Rubrobacteraceae bacterium]